MATLAPERISIDTIADKVYANQRISAEEATFLYKHPNILDLATLADYRRKQKADPKVVTYIIGRILNYTNVCWVRCKFCAFYRTPNHDEGYLHSDEDILAKVQDTVEKGGVEILFQGGLNPKLKIDYYEGIFSKIKAEYPEVILHALSPAEIIYIAHISKLSLLECLERLKAAGLHSIPGAGGEILVDRVRAIIAPYKDTTRVAAVSYLLHSPRPIPDLYAIATRDYAPDPAAWDLVMAHHHQNNIPPKPGDRPGLIGFGDSTSGKTSAIMVKLNLLRKEGYTINFLSATELATVVRESASDYRSFAAISSHLCGKGTDEDLADAYCEAIGSCGPLGYGVEISKFLCAYPQVEEDPLFRKWFSPDGLFLDDLHIPRFTDAYARTLYDIIEKRTANFHALLLTSQLSAQQLYDKWKNDSPDLADTAWAIINRINQRCVPVQFVKGAPAPSLLLPGASKGRPRQSAAGRTPERAHGHPRASSRTESKS